ncbi:MAG TPA: hypothetical protein EYH39_02340 [Desulfurobacteriaceae bacterium]|nr:hypothetical protein [Desulfurobacteriaceae bacterium]
MGCIKIALAQINPKLGNLKYNLKLHIDYIKKAQENECDLIIFPENSLTGYYLKDLTYEVAIKENDLSLFEIYNYSNSLGILIGFIEESEHFEYFSSSALIFKKKLLFKHRKVFLPSYSLFDEKRFLKEGNSFKKTNFLSFKLGNLICEDAWHLISYLNLLYSDIIIVQANSPYQEGIEEFYLSLGKTISTLLGCYFIFVNRVGYEDGISFWGNSFVYSPLGKLILRLSDKEEIAYFFADKREIRQARVKLPLIKEWDKYKYLLKDISNIG